ncbi:hypothetical protein DL98DRAFT_662419 [Cadophora sp. DSE1049]|nr:hypothetical protein DL98DRAFT_662419 [Cadophora sp. DSE1049]
MLLIVPLYLYNPIFIYLTLNWPPMVQPVTRQMRFNQRVVGFGDCDALGISLSHDYEGIEVLGPSEDRQPAEDLGKDLPAGEVSKDLPAVASPSEDQPTTDGPLEDPKPAEVLTIASPAGESLSNTRPAKEPSTTLPHLNSPSDGQQTTKVQAGDRQTAEGPTTDQQVEKAPEDTAVSESLPNGQSTKDLQRTAPQWRIF